jgi:hypothetical protein
MLQQECLYVEGVQSCFPFVVRAHLLSGQPVEDIPKSCNHFFYFLFSDFVVTNAFGRKNHCDLQNEQRE